MESKRPLRRVVYVERHNSDFANGIAFGCLISLLVVAILVVMILLIAAR